MTYFRKTLNELVVNNLGMDSHDTIAFLKLSEAYPDPQYDGILSDLFTFTMTAIHMLSIQDLQEVINKMFNNKGKENENGNEPDDDDWKILG